MQGIQLARLLDEPATGVPEVLNLVAGFDGVLVDGLTRLTPDHTAALTAIADALGGSPLGPPTTEAVTKIITGSITEDHLAVLADARAALLGAVHDELLAHVDSALGRTRSAWSGSEPVRTAADRSWLAELAITGWRGTDHDLVAAADTAVEALLAKPGQRRLAVLLDGLAAELRASCPVAARERIPARRWADLWTRAFLLSHGADAPEPVEEVSGRLLILGVDVHEHGTAVQMQVHAILEPGTPEPGRDAKPRLVRISVTVAKVDTIVGPAVWRLLADHPMLLTALAEHRILDVERLPLLPSGDLLWHDDRATAGEPADPFTTARIRLAKAEAPSVPPLDRHPVRIAEPVLIEGYKTVGDASEPDGPSWTLDGHSIAVEADRLPTCGPITPKTLARSDGCIGLVRWDAGRWSLRPLAVRTKGKAVHTGDLALVGNTLAGNTVAGNTVAGKTKDDAVAVLRERAGRLLRR